MAEAIAALSLASNILQVLEFGAKFASTAWKIHNIDHRVPEVLGELTALNTISNNLSDVLQDIRTAPGFTDLASPSNQGILNLSKECAIFVEKLVNSLNKLYFGDAARKRNAIAAAFMLTWGRDDIRSLQATLNDFRSQLTLSLLVSIRLVLC